MVPIMRDVETPFVFYKIINFGLKKYKYHPVNPDLSVGEDLTSFQKAAGFYNREINESDWINF